MRVSTNSGDPGYENFVNVFHAQCWVLLDGERIDNRCVMADEELGIAELYAVDDDGDFIVEGDQIKTEIHHGAVVVMPVGMEPS